MAHLRNIKSDAVVSVSDEKAARMGSQWESADQPASKKTAAKKAPSSKPEK